MKDFFHHLLNATRAQARYRRTRDEIARMPLDIALDLGMYPGDADRISHRAVYGV